MHTIFKYPLTQPHTEFRIPALDWEPLCVQMQDGIPCVWMSVDTEITKPTPYQFYIEATGHPRSSPRHAFYVGTYQDGPFVGHVFMTRTVGAL